MMEDEIRVEEGYKKEEDFSENEHNQDNQKKEKYGNYLLRTEFENFMTEETSEPDIMFWCKDNNEASQLLRKCIKLMNEKNWQTMKKYLREIGI
jgi:hypothetical protein